ncbi:hypothetical protein GCM10027419_18940 [Pandoraea terrae]
MEEAHWIEAGLNAPADKRSVTTRVPGLDITRVDDRSLVTLLGDGDLDAVIAPHASSNQLDCGSRAAGARTQYRDF